MRRKTLLLIVGFFVFVTFNLAVYAQESLLPEDFQISGDYAFSIKKLNLSLGHIYYDFPGVNGYTKEFYLGLSYEGFLSPSFTWNHDYHGQEKGGGDGDYYTLALSYSVSIGQGISLDLSGHIGYNNGLFIKGSGGDLAIATGLNIPMTEHLSITPNLNFSLPFGDLEDENNGNQNKKLFGGIVMTYDF